LFFSSHRHPPALHPFPTRRSSDLLVRCDHTQNGAEQRTFEFRFCDCFWHGRSQIASQATRLNVTWRFPSSSSIQVRADARSSARSEEHTSELQSPYDLVCRLLLEK